MTTIRYLICLLLPLVLCTCAPAPEQPETGGVFPIAEPIPEPVIVPLPAPDYDTSQWVELVRLDTSFRLEIRYATDSNFMERKIYDCGRCFYRPAVARALAAAQAEFRKQGLGLKMFDCYRPQPYQQRLWDVMPDARYVANPARGSVHSRGAAADLTLIDLATGKELNMGTPYDYFGEAAYTTTTDLPAQVLENRTILQDVLRRHGFATIRTEWWHFNFSGPRFELSDWVWACPET
ncbi:D-alanyl-D-alanine dipeptidase [Lewinella aquimaris]|uniref:D-alanyl-D-alanine dipeptidase n=1 Tax=Neolewinella aquimaris TaxID=1835722 RepID=A0A840E7V3_9BACT|nr:M15 family metallopeptidase [Neolewinella aquimaris]MBB4079357.1 D-alanyl-D-alanine dipeptidase [Neolewinella aquimaris]